MASTSASGIGWMTSIAPGEMSIFPDQLAFIARLERAGHRGLLAIDAVDVVDDKDITNDQAHRAGYTSVDALRRELARRPEGEVYRIRLHHLGDDPRIALRTDVDLDAEQIETIRAKLDRLDRTREKPWTRAVLELIRSNAATRAPDLASSFGQETKAFKTDVRRLEALGLTESLVVGYRLSPRGETFLARLGPPAHRPPRDDM